MRRVSHGLPGRPRAAAYGGAVTTAIEQRVVPRRSAPTRCEWCARELPQQEGVGRRRRYCGQSCRQRAYEQRAAVQRGVMPADAVVLTIDERDDLSDRLFQVRCAAEDARTALAERAGSIELAELLDRVLLLAREAERIR
jgi:hypothetical protein